MDIQLYQFCYIYFASFQKQKILSFGIFQFFVDQTMRLQEVYKTNQESCCQSSSYIAQKKYKQLRLATSSI